MKLLLIYAILIACIALSVNAESENCQNVKEELNLKFEIQNDQQHDSDEQFVAVHINELGIQSINPLLPSIEAIVEPFLPKNSHFLYAINVTREIVNGFKYEIFFVMKSNENNEEIYCVMDIIEKPWLIKDSRKHRKMAYNNCSLINPIDDDDRIHFQYEVNPTFNNHRTELSSEDLKIMEDQIIALKDSDEESIETTTVILDDVTLNPSSKNILDGFFNMQDYFIAQPQTTTTTYSPLSDFNLATLDEMLGIRKDESVTQQKNFESAAKKDNETLKHLEIQIKRAFSELFQSDPEFQLNIVALINRRDDSETQKNYNQIIEILGRKLQDKLESFQNERISHEENENDQQVTVNPHEYIFRKRRSFRSFFLVKELNCVDSHEIDVLTCADCSIELDQNGKISATRCLNRQKRQGLGRRKKNDLLPGGVRTINVDDPDLKLFLDEALAKINDDEDPDYEPIRIVEASVQVVSGTLHRFKVEMKRDGNPVICNFEVWEQVWKVNGREVKVACENEKKYKFTQASRTRNSVNSRKRRSAQGGVLVGGASEIEKDDEDVNKLLAKHLSRLDTGSDTKLELVSVDKITQQVVAGIKYIVDGNFKFGDESKKCVVEIWHRAWIQGDDGTQLRADCDNGIRFKTRTRSKRSIHHHHHRPKPDHSEEHHERSRERHHHSAIKQMEEVKHEILFENFVKKFERKYANDAEHIQRLRIFKRNLHKIDMLNKHEQGTAKYGINELADLTEKEYLRKTGLIVPQHHENYFGNPIADIPDVPLPEEFDWRDKKAITNVKNQGNCGSCWSFSVTGNIEGLHAIKTGKLEAYSEQELLDCDTTDSACNGGYMDDAFKAIEKIGGLELEDEYPYLAKKQKKCMFNQTLSHVKVKGVVDMPKGDEVSMQKFLVSTGPISIGINAAAMQFYRGGVSHPWKVLCRKSNLDHGVLIVGYGKKEYPMFNKTLPYWTIKNSWGPKWGEQGYYRIYRGDNVCGVAEMASSAVLE